MKTSGVDHVRKSNHRPRNAERPDGSAVTIDDAGRVSAFVIGGARFGNYRAATDRPRVKNDNRMVMGGLNFRLTPKTTLGGFGGYAQPMTAQFKDATGPIWFFATRKSELVMALTSPKRAMAHYVAKGHDLFATIHGALQIATNNARIIEYWVDTIAAWYDGGKRDPESVLLRLDLESAKIWLSGSGIGMAIKSLLGGEKAASEEQVAKVSLTAQQ